MRETHLPTPPLMLLVATFSVQLQSIATNSTHRKRVYFGGMGPRHKVHDGRVTPGEWNWKPRTPFLNYKHKTELEFKMPQSFKPLKHCRGGLGGDIFSPSKAIPLQPPIRGDPGSSLTPFKQNIEFRHLPPVPLAIFPKGSK